MFAFSLFLIILIFNTAKCHFYLSNATDLDKCQVHYARSGGVYKDFYSISNLEETANSSLELDFHFAVLAPSDAHILLAQSENVKKSDPAYEIVIGAGGNSFCDIRRKQKSEVKASVRIKGLLSALDPNFFWIHISKEGDIEVGKDGEELPFISWIDSDPLPVKVISFSTWSNVEAKWYFDCKRNDIQEIEKQLTPLEKIRKNLILPYNSYVRPVLHPSTLTTVRIAMQLRNLELDTYKSVVEVSGMTKIEWYDEKLQWDPVDYDNLTTLHIFRREIWQPDLVLYNAIDNLNDILQDSMMIAHHTGLIQWNPPIKLKTFCNIEDLKNWPKDKHQCNFIMGFVRDFEGIRLDFLKNGSGLILHEKSQWNVIQAEIYTENFENYTTSDPVMFQISLTVERKFELYHLAFNALFLLKTLTVLSSFFLDPIKSNKISINCFLLILTTITLLTLGNLTPKQSEDAPHLLTIYSYGLLAITVAVVLSIMVVNLARINRNKPLNVWLISMLNSRIFGATFFLPKIELNVEYGQLSREESSVNSMWYILAIFIDRISFLVYFLLAAYVIYTLH